MAIRYNFNPKTALGLLFMMVLMILISNVAEGQVDSLLLAETHISKEKYFGYSIKAASQIYRLESGISEIDDVVVRREGGSIGVMAGNRKGFVKSTIGLYYSAPSTPFTIDVVEAAISANVYLLRLSDTRSHTIEPFASIMTKALRSSFFDTYPAKDTKNMSLTKEKLSGRTTAIQALICVGAEYQLVSEKLQFIHIFVSAGYGMSIANYASNAEFSGTKVKNPLSFAFGVNFGKIR